jgi:hypothetical protein
LDNKIKIIEALITLIDSCYNISFFYKQEKIDILDILNRVNSDSDNKKYFQKQFGISPEICIFILNNKVINKNLLNSAIYELRRETEA